MENWNRTVSFGFKSMEEQREERRGREAPSLFLSWHVCRGLTKQNVTLGAWSCSSDSSH
ncbi:hypothetical protein NC653_011435 [Populus alba x Populus x berolinensis]|uniref:Uncharacterized protein n=1 Tax=Populus alba x Populus x berolinensis TaxID=444605 RepID=A0AAD6R271_9ROSI|nr:hypothetical protein NC653_011435 [Populus alba x Populus x berolinensis]